MKESKLEISKVYTIRWKNIGIRKSEFVTKTLFLSKFHELKTKGIEYLSQTHMS